LSRASAIEAGEKWADFCAGPGGKAALLAAEASNGAARISCFEVAEHRTKLVDTALRHSIDHGVYDITTADSRELGREMPERFDRIMLDAPCSGLGALRRRPEARWRKSSRDLADLGTLQNELFDSAVAALKPGGLLAYVTCSPHPSETSAVVDGALKRHKHIELLNANKVLAAISPALAPKLNPARKTAQLWPHIHGTDAMFIALIKKN
jgi:16S rRNA (cytosine967-C5)-methyltransferase